MDGSPINEMIGHPDLVRTLSHWQPTTYTEAAGRGHKTWTRRGRRQGGETEWGERGEKGGKRQKGEHGKANSLKNKNRAAVVRSKKRKVEVQENPGRGGGAESDPEEGTSRGSVVKERGVRESA